VSQVGRQDADTASIATSTTPEAKIPAEGQALQNSTLNVDNNNVGTNGDSGTVGTNNNVAVEERSNNVAARRSSSYLYRLD